MRERPRARCVFLLPGVGWSNSSSSDGPAVALKLGVGVGVVEHSNLL